ncbi:hypothetical protein QBC46DRAFT_366412 [Diplogelasinospora grovesii]|uniref:Uncharacterized protein n=1 Tax=Diplogelasinospora grovesii TaxID=303347 RepID=A0AAN6N105_9PEZI|nr:hypothetical protein QBC46DRAFT_366412 [Diplogelasinospora grovesii]
MMRGIEDQPPRPPALLRLPPHLRHRIYLHIGIARRDGRPNTYYLDGRKELPGFASAFDPPPTRNFTGLLRSCRDLYTEVAALLYSANQFVMHAGKASLEPLQALSPTAIASLTSLKMVLNECSCHHPVDSRDYPPLCCCDDVEHEPEPNGIRARCAQYHRSTHRRPLLDPVSPGLDSTSSKLVAQALLTRWNDAAVHLSSHVRPGRLALSLEVTWCRRYPRCYQVCRPPCDPEGRGPPCQPYIHHGCRLSQCLGVDFDPSGGPPPGPGCFCRRRHAAFSFTCNCWAPPTSIFLVCHALYRDAQLVFFSRNRFIVHDVQAWPGWTLDYTVQKPRDPETASIEESYPYERLAASHFLREFVPANCLAYLRFLELVFPPYWPYSWPVDDHPAIVDWRDTVNWLRGKIDAPALTIRVVFADFLQNPAGSRSGTTKDEGKQIVRGYMHVIRALEPLLKHDGLAAPYVQAAFPWGWARDVLLRQLLEPDDWWTQELARQEQRLKELLERIPGCEAIVDSRNKPEPRRSAWQTCVFLLWASPRHL